jgi:hypothetical protein
LRGEQTDGAVKRRFLQFSIRGLLSFAALVCLLLGGWHLLHAYGNYIKVSTAAVGKPMRVKGRLVRVFGPPKCSIEIDGHIPNRSSPLWREGTWAARSWLCCYEFDEETAPLMKPGELMVDAELYPPDREDDIPLAVAKTKMFTVQPGVPDGTEWHREWSE